MATVTPERLKEVVVEVLTGFGAAEDEAPLIADSLVRAEMRGTDTHGLPYLKLLAERVKAGMVSLPTRVARKVIVPFLLMLAPVTWSPAFFSTGMLSPVSMDSSTEV